MSRERKPRAVIQSEQITFRVPENVISAAEARADELGMTLSEFCRDALRRAVT